MSVVSFKRNNDSIASAPLAARLPLRPIGQLDWIKQNAAIRNLTPLLQKKNGWFLSGTLAACDTLIMKLLLRWVLLKDTTFG